MVWISGLKPQAHKLNVAHNTVLWSPSNDLYGEKIQATD